LAISLPGHQNAFLHGELQEVYMDQPPDFNALGDYRLVYRFRCSLYGLKSASRAWFDHFSFALLQFRMTCCEADHSVFFIHSLSSRCIYFIVYVDDIAITGNDSEGILRLKSHLRSQFQTKDTGLLNYFLGIEVVGSSSSIAISQQKYALIS